MNTSAFLVPELAYDTVKALKLLDVMLSGCFRETVGVLLAHDRSLLASTGILAVHVVLPVDHQNGG